MTFEIKKRVCFCDTDAGGIMYHSKYLDYCEEARLEYFIKFGCTQKILKEKYDIIFVLKHCEIEYKYPARAEDMLRVTIDEINIKGPILYLKQNVYLDKVLCASCNLKLVAINGDFKPVRKMPDVFNI